MKITIPELHDANRDGWRVYHYVAPPVVNALTLVGVGLVALAIALAYAAEGSGVAAKEGGRRGR